MVADYDKHILADSRCRKRKHMQERDFTLLSMLIQARCPTDAKMFFSRGARTGNLSGALDGAFWACESEYSH